MTSAILNPSRATVKRQRVQADEAAACRLECRLCEVAAGRGDLYVELYGQSPLLNVAGVPQSLAVMVDSFPIGHAGGHVLVAPRYHARSLAMFASQVALREATQVVTDLLTAMFPNYWLFAFEHGPGEIGHEPVACGGCHVDHAHGHILVLPRSVEFEEIRELTEDALEDIGWNLATQTNQSRTPLVGIRRFVGHNPYLHIGMFARERSIAVTYTQRSAEESVPSQLLRRLVATACGRPEPSFWNWKVALAAGLDERIEEYRRAALGFQVEVREWLRVEG